jgi:hypothetical protein
MLVTKHQRISIALMILHLCSEVFLNQQFLQDSSVVECYARLNGKLILCLSSRYVLDFKEKII